MLDFTKYEKTQVDELISVIQKNIEKSELERYYPFSQVPTEKAKVYVFCMRFLYNMYNLMDECQLKKDLKEELEKNKIKYQIIYDSLIRISRSNYNEHKYFNKIKNELLNDTLVDEVIDAFTVLLERTSVMSMSRFMGVVLEGKSKEAYEKIMKEPLKNQEEIEVQQMQDSENYSSYVDDSSISDEDEDENEDSKEDSEEDSLEEAEKTGEEVFQAELRTVEKKDI